MAVQGREYGIGIGMVCVTTCEGAALQAESVSDTAMKSSNSVLLDTAVKIINSVIYHVTAERSTNSSLLIYHDAAM